MPINRREMLASMAAVATTTLASRRAPLLPSLERTRPLTSLLGQVDWTAVRDLFPLTRDWTHFASFLFVSHPKPVAESIDFYRRKLDADAVWIEDAALTDSEGRPYRKVKAALAEYAGGEPTEICLTSNTTTALAMAYHGLRIRRNQEILTTEHDHFSHHESIRYSAARSGAAVRYI